MQRQSDLRKAPLRTLEVGDEATRVIRQGARATAKSAPLSDRRGRFMLAAMTDMRVFAAVLPLLAACFTTSQGAGGAPVDPGPPDGRWRRVASLPPGPVKLDPGVVACVEPERHSYLRGQQAGWVDRCGWRRHTTCVERCPLIMSGCTTTCDDTTPEQLRHDNVALHVRRLFAASEPCGEDEAGAALIHAGDDGHMTWRVTGCGRRGRFACRWGEHPSGARCERLAFDEEASAELLDELAGPFAARTGHRPECRARIVGGSPAPIKLADGRPGLALALSACDVSVAFECVRPDLIPPGTPACRELGPSPEFVAQALRAAGEKIEQAHRCELAPGAGTLVREELESVRRRAIVQITSCNATRDVVRVRCSSTSLVDATVSGCWLESNEEATRAAKTRASEIASARHAECGRDRSDVTVLATTGDSQLVLVRCRRDARSDDAQCAVDEALQAAADALERGARARFMSDEQCPDGKTVSLAVEGQPGAWRVRVSGCGVSRDYACRELTDPIARCNLR